MKTIQAWRSQIDHIDAQLVRLLNQRARLAVHLARVKRHSGLPVRSPRREQEVLWRALRSNPGPLDRGAMGRLFRQIIRESRRLAQRASSTSKARRNSHA